MNTVEDRLQDALRERAAHSPISSAAWERTVARTRRRPRRRPTYLIPVVAAAAVTAIIVTASLVAGQLTRGQGATGRIPAAAQSSSPAVAPTQDDNVYIVPPRSAVLRLHYAPPGNTARHSPADADRGTVWFDFYVGYRSTAYWWINVSPGPQLCVDSWQTYVSKSDPGPMQTAVNQAICEPAPSLAPGQVVRVVTGTAPGSDELWGAAFGTDVMRQGIAARQVASVTAVLPDGRSYPGAVGTARGLGENAWSVMYPPDGTVRLVFRDAAGHEVAELTKPANPVVPGQDSATRPAHGGVSVAGGEMTAYLIDGYVGFWPTDRKIWPDVISAYPVNRGPALGAVDAQYEFKNTGPLPGQKKVAQFGFYGYARADVSRVVLRYRTPTLSYITVTASMAAASWPGSTVKLWSAPLPANYSAVLGTATAYDAAGHIISTVKIADWAP